MPQIIDIHEYDDFFYEQFTKKILPRFDIWSIRPLQNPAKVFAHGFSSEINKLDVFFSKLEEKNYSIDLLIILAVAQKNYPRLMLNSSKRYIHLHFSRLSF